jgi:5-methylcytosine-specific restriction endonuclease McrA
MEKYRVCPGCKTNLPFSAFGKKSGSKARKDGTRSRCKACESQAYKIYCEINREKVKATKQKWQSKNPHKKAAYAATYRLKNLEKIKQYQIVYTRNHVEDARVYRANRPQEAKDRKKLQDKDYARKNRHKNRAATRRYRLNNPEKVRDSAKKYRLANKELQALKSAKRRSIKNDNSTFQVTRKELLKLYSSNCFYCGVSGRMELDHVIPVSRGGSNSIGNFVASCRPCNASKGKKTITEWKKWKKDYAL